MSNYAIHRVFRAVDALLLFDLIELFPLNCSEVMKLSAVKNNSKNG